MDAFIGYTGKERFHYPLSNLRKHFFSLGSSGSGKTVLSKVIIEELALNGIPSIAVDPQGDLASLILPGKPDQIKSHGLSEENLKKYKENVRVTIFSPISSKGIPVCLNPLDIVNLKAPEEELIPIINQVSTSLSKLLGYSSTHDKGKAAETILYTILMESQKKGKSIGTFENLASKIESMDENLKAELTPFLANEKEIEALVRKIRFLTVGEKELLFNFGVPLDINMLLGKGKYKTDKTQVSVIYLNTLTSQEQKEFFVSILTTELYQWMLQNPSEDISCAYFIDEIAPFIPAGSEKPIPKNILKLLFKQARKYGVACLIATQNPGDIDYKAFAQFGTWAIGRLTVKQDQKKVENALKSLSPEEISTRLPSIQTGHFLLFSPDISDAIIELRSRWLYTAHKTFTDTDIQESITTTLREHYKPYLIKSSTKINEYKKEKKEGEPVKQEPIIESKEQHFKLMIGDAEIKDLIEKNRKKHFLIGPAKEDVASFTLALKPLVWAQVTKSEKKIFRKIKHSQLNLLVDAKTGEILIYRNNQFFKIHDFGRLSALTASEIQILRFLALKRQPFFAADLSLKTEITKASVTKSLKKLVRHKLVTYEKTKKNIKYFSIIDLPELNISEVDSDRPVLTKEKIPATVQKPTLSIKQLEKMVSNWFTDSIIVSHEIIYLPVYIIRYHSNRGERKVEINGVTGKQASGL